MFRATSNLDTFFGESFFKYSLKRLTMTGSDFKKSGKVLTEVFTSNYTEKFYKSISNNFY